MGEWKGFSLFLCWYLLQNIILRSWSINFRLISADTYDCAVNPLHYDYVKEQSHGVQKIDGKPY